MQKLIKYITDRQPLLNISQLERLAGCPERSIHKAIIGTHTLAEKHWSPIIQVLCTTFGSIEMDGWIISYADGAFFTNRETKEVVCKEPKPGVFEYISTQSRQVYDEFDFINYFLK